MYNQIIILLCIQLLFFLWLGHKTTLFSVLLLMGSYHIATVDKKELFISKVTVSLVALVSLLEANSVYFPQNISNIIHWTYSLLIRRSLFTPAFLKFSYYDFFVIQDNPKVGLFGTFIAPILTRLGITQPYGSTPYTAIIGARYTNAGFANTGVWGMELAHFGIFGILFATVFLILMLLYKEK